MKTPFARAIVLLLILFVAVPPSWATCGGGGGGGGGGISVQPTEVYRVPWHIAAANDPPPSAGLVLYWFPSSNEELRVSSLRTSRTLTLYSSQCVAMEVADSQSSAGVKFASGASLPVAVLTTADGKVIGKSENQKGFLRVEEVEKLVDHEVKQRETAVEERMKEGKGKAKSGDKDGAVAAYREVVEQKCLFPKKAKDAAKELKKLGVDLNAQLLVAPDATPVYDRRQSAKIVATMQRGLRAELDEDYVAAEKLYA